MRGRAKHTKESIAMRIFLSTGRLRLALAALALGAATLLAACGAPVSAASTTAAEDLALGALAGMRALERGSSAPAEAALDTAARALSMQQGYAANSFRARPYVIGPVSQHVIVASFDMALHGAGWTRAPALAHIGGSSSTVGWTRDRGREALVVGYGPDAETGRMFVAVLRAAR
jgi:hypothetical protein